MRIVGISSTSAPSRASRSVNALACRRVRVTTTRWPKSGSASNQFSSLPQPHHLADHGDRRRREATLLHQIGHRRQRALEALLPRRRAPAHQRHRRGGIGALRHQPLRDLAQPLHAHQKNFRPAQPRQVRPIDRRFRLGRVLVAGDERHRRGEIAMRHRNARVGRRGDGRRHARHHLERQCPRARAPAPPRRRGQRHRDRRP